MGSQEDTTQKPSGRNNQEHSERTVSYIWTHKLSYTKRLALMFASIAAVTALIIAGVLAVVWERQFQNYSQQRVERIGHETASSLAERYGTFGGWGTNVLSQASMASALYDGITIRVLDKDGAILYDDAWNSDVEAGHSMSDTPLSGTEATVTAPVVVDGEEVGMVQIRSYSDNSLLTENDVAFRKSSYQAILVVAILAVLLASALGAFFARGLVNPIRRITKTADALKEGDLKARTNLEGNDELAQLGETFDTMATAIEKDRMLERRLTMDVAHELRTPLMAMQSTIEAMVDGVLPADETRLLTLNSEVVRLGRLVEALLKLSRLENRANPLREEEIDVSTLVSDLVLAHEMLIEDAGLSITFQGEEDVRVIGDKDLVRQAVANLISNAVRYTPLGGVIEVKVHKGDIMAQISVSDTGIGISEEDLKHVFSRFWRADAGRTRETGGLGIGLAVVKESVDRHHGWVNVESVINEGTTFTIYIPLYTEDARKKRERAARQAASKERSASRARGVNRLRPARYSPQTVSHPNADKEAVKAAEKTAEEYAKLVARSAADEAAKVTQGAADEMIGFRNENSSQRSIRSRVTGAPRKKARASVSDPDSAGRDAGTSDGNSDLPDSDK